VNVDDLVMYPGVVVCIMPKKPWPRDFHFQTMPCWPSWSYSRGISGYSTLTWTCITVRIHKHTHSRTFSHLVSTLTWKLRVSLSLSLLPYSSVLPFPSSQGDGVEEAFYTTDRVMTVSLHKYAPQEGFFPCTGAAHETGQGDGKGYAINVPLDDGIGDDAYLGIFRTIIGRIMDTYRPQSIVLQCGADSLSGDVIGTFNLTTGVGDKFGYALASACLISPLPPRQIASRLPLAATEVLRCA
jgi:hypothetical protein